MIVIVFDIDASKIESRSATNVNAKRDIEHIMRLIANEWEYYKKK